MSSGHSDAAIGEQERGGQRFQICVKGLEPVWVNWQLTGEHNQRNALHALLAARHVGITPEVSAEALSQFKSVKRRMELLGQFAGVSLYDDFAHHPTAIATTLKGMRATVHDEKLIAIIEPRSNTMKQGVFKSQLAESASQADTVFWYQPDSLGWSLDEQMADLDGQQVFNSIDMLLESLVSEIQPNSHIVVMSNGGFEGIHERIKQLLTSTQH
jgi:UDP-N-acetylmuramate: L-alanyl-gamma-D-glutamyl-meso-diaminopimelate ligase